jgi:TonB family protein
MHRSTDSSRIHPVLVATLLLACRTAPAPPPPAEGAPRVLDKDEVRQVVRANIHEVKACYEQKGLARDGDLTGRVGLQFTLDPRGAVADARVQSSTFPPGYDDLTVCIVERLRTWRFPATGGVVAITYPFVFEPSRPVTSPSGLVAGTQSVGRWFLLPVRPPGTLVVEVLGPNGAAAPGVVVTLAIERKAEPPLTLQAPTDARGHVEFTGLPPAGLAGASVDADPTHAASHSIRTHLDGRAIGTILVRDRVQP